MGRGRGRQGPSGTTSTLTKSRSEQTWVLCGPLVLGQGGTATEEETSDKKCHSGGRTLSPIAHCLPRNQTMEPQAGSNDKGRAEEPCSRRGQLQAMVLRQEQHNMTITRCHDRFTTNNNTHGRAWPCDSFRNGTGLIVCLWTALQVPLLMCCPFQKLNQAAGGGWGSWP